MVQRCHHWIFLDNGPLASEAFRCASSSSVPVLWLCWGVGRGETLVLGAAGGQRSFLCACLGFMSSGFGLLSVTPYSLAGSVVAFRHFMMVCFISIFSHPFPRWKGPCSWAFTRHVRYRTSSGNNAFLKVEALCKRAQEKLDSTTGSVLSFGHICEMNTTEQWERSVLGCGRGG